MKFSVLVWFLFLGISCASAQTFALNSSTNIVDVNNNPISFERFVYLTNNYEHKLRPMFAEDGSMYKVELDLLNNNAVVFNTTSADIPEVELAEVLDFKSMHEIYDYNKWAFTNVNELEGLNAPNFKVFNVNNKSIELYDLKDKVVVINFWFSKCAPCIEEMPDLNRLKKKYAGKRVEFLAMSVEDYKYTEKFLTKNDFDFNIIPEAQQVAAAYKTIGYPTTIVVGVNKKVDKVYTGAMSNVYDVLDQELQKCLIQREEDAYVELMNRGESLVFKNTTVYGESGKKLKEDEFYALLMNYHCSIYKHVTTDESTYYTIIKTKSK